ncbi:MAG: TonB-dependent receptor [Pseudomonadota bacterium]
MRQFRAKLAATAGLMSLCLAAALPISATAQEQDDEASSLAFDPVIITATKRAEDLQDVPVSVTAVSGEDLDLFGGAGDDIQFLSARVPSLVIESSFGRIFPRPYIRGLGNTDFDFNASQPVSFVYDEVVFENPVLKGFPVFDVEQVEVLRGPQGTLFGRNTPAGIIKFDSVKPGDELDGYGRIAYGRFNAVQVEGAFGGPVTDWLSVRASGQYQRRDDFIDNQVLGEDGDAGGFDDFAYRIQALLEPTEEFSWLLNAHGRVLDDGQVSFQANALAAGEGGAVPGFDRTVSFADAGADSFLDTDTFGITSKADYDFSFATLTYVFGYERVETFSRGDVDGGFGAIFFGPGSGLTGPLALNGDGSLFTSPAFPDGFAPLFPAETADSIEDLDQFTHEVRLSNGADERFDWTLGFYYFDEDVTIGSFNFDTLAGGTPNGTAFQTQETESIAVFGSASFELTEQLTLAGGVRWTDDDRDFVAERIVPVAPPAGPGTLLPATTLQVGDDDVSWDVSATYAVTDDINFYARIARGFRAPSIQGRVLFGDAITTADSEELTSYEAGLKSTLLDGRIIYNISGFYYEIDDQQLTAIGGAGNFNQLLNIDEGIGFGIEAELDVVITEELTLTSGFSWNETEINDPTAQAGICGAPCTVLDPVVTAADGTPLAQIDGNPFPNAPEFIFNFVLSYERPILSGDMFAVTDWAFRSDANIFLYESVEFESDAFIEGGLRAGYRQDNWEFAAFARNITGVQGVTSAIDFNNFSGIFNQPRTWGIELSFTY